MLYGALTLTATVQSSAGGALAGTVTFTVGGATMGTAPVTAGASGLGTATLAVSSATQTLGFTAGSDTITAAMAEIRSMALRPGPQPLR